MSPINVLPVTILNKFISRAEVLQLRELIQKNTIKILSIRVSSLIIRERTAAKQGNNKRRLSLLRLCLPKEHLPCSIKSHSDRFLVLIKEIFQVNKSLYLFPRSITGNMRQHQLCQYYLQQP